MFGRGFGRAFGLYFGVYDWWAEAVAAVTTDLIGVACASKTLTATYVDLDYDGNACATISLTGSAEIAKP